MSKHLIKKQQSATRRKGRVRAKISGTKDKPRLSVHVSNLHVTAQIIDDEAKTTLAYASTVGKKNLKGTLTDKAAAVGSDIAKQALAKKIKTVVFDRGAKIYHGRVAALADAARKEGLEL